LNFKLTHYAGLALPLEQKFSEGKTAFWRRYLLCAVFLSARYLGCIVPVPSWHPNAAQFCTQAFNRRNEFSRSKAGADMACLLRVQQCPQCDDRAHHGHEREQQGGKIGIKLDAPSPKVT
jgi:hypothetical protein